MSELLGAEFAPSIFVGYVTETGGFYATLDAVPMITLHNNERVKVANVEAVRQLSCDDPDDMRAICRLAAMALGASEDVAFSARLQNHLGHRRLLVRKCSLSAEKCLWLHDAPAWQVSLSVCVAALCAHVWGPK